MKAYGLPRNVYSDTDVLGCVENGRPTSLGRVAGPGGDVSAFNALRGGKKARARRHWKRVARAEGRAACADF
jgi:hypothetical protein